MTSTKPKKTQRPKTREEILLRRLKFTKHSQAIEGLHLTDEQLAVFEDYIRNGFESDELDRTFMRFFSAMRMCSEVGDG